MNKKMIISIILVLMILTSISCSYKKNSSQVSKTDNSTTTDNAGARPKNIDLVTKKDYKINDEIAIGDNVDVIAKEGILKDRLLNYLGADNSGNIIAFNDGTNDIESIDSHGKPSIMMNIMGERKNHVYTIKKFGDIVAWSECPHADQDPATDPTNGADWALYYVGLKTKAIKKLMDIKKELLYQKTLNIDISALIS